MKPGDVVRLTKRPAEIELNVPDGALAEVLGDKTPLPNFIGVRWFFAHKDQSFGFFPAAWFEMHEAVE